MRLTDLDATFLKITRPQRWRMGVPIEEAQGISFLCPKCFKKNKGKAGTHSIVCWFAGRGVPDDLDPKPGRWNPSGTSIDDLSFVGPGKTSVLLMSGCQWHGFVNKGDAK